MGSHRVSRESGSEGMKISHLKAAECACRAHARRLSAYKPQACCQIVMGTLSPVQIVFARS